MGAALQRPADAVHLQAAATLRARAVPLRRALRKGDVQRAPVRAAVVRRSRQR